MKGYHLDHLQHLETEAMHIMREVAGEFERPALLFSGGKDSICLLRLAEKAFRPSDIPLPFLNVETGHEFPELIEFRDRRAKQLGAKLIVRTVDQALANGTATQAPGEVSRNKLQIPVLLGAIEEFRFDCAIGGARRDEEKARAKERFFSFRDSFGQWDPKNQRPEIWNIYNGRINPGENMRVFPLSNWTEQDVWEYIRRDQLAVPTIYFSHRRAKQLGAKLIIRTVEDAIKQGIATPAPGEISRNKLQIPVLLAAIEEFRFDCCIGGARRDEEKARAKERFFSFRDSFGQWDPKNQRPEIWNLYNGRLNAGENMRVFPLSNWTEMDVWEYIKREHLEVPKIYFSHTRECFRRGARSGGGG